MYVCIYMHPPLCWCLTFQHLESAYNHIYGIFLEYSNHIPKSSICQEYSWNICPYPKACIALVSSLECTGIKDVVNIGVQKLSCKKEFVSGSYRYDNLSVEYAWHILPLEWNMLIVSVVYCLCFFQVKRTMKQLPDFWPSMANTYPRHAASDEVKQIFND